MEIKDTPGFWRGIAGVVIGIWLMVFAVNLFDMDPEKVPQRELDSMTFSCFLIASGCTTLALGFLFMFPRQFYIYTGVFCFWGLSALVEGGNVTASLMYLLGLGFAYRQGFFKTVRGVKIFISILLVIGAVVTQYRHGASVVINTVFSWIALCLIGGLAYILFLPELERLRGSRGEGERAGQGTSETAGVSLTREDQALVDLIRQGAKYEHIAIELGLSVPTVKRRVKQLFHDWGVSNRNEFLSRYGEAGSLL